MSLVTPLRVGLLGASRIAPKAMIAPIAKRDDMEIVALACRDTDRGAAYAAEHDLTGIDIHGDYATLCARDDIDLIYNPLPPSLHLDIAKAAARHDRIQLIEKPFAMTADEAREIATLPSIFIMEAFHYVFHPAFHAFEAAVKTLGPIHNITGRFHVTIPNRDGELRHIAKLGGGALMDLGCYPLHMARRIAGREPKIVAAKAIEGNPGIDLYLAAQLDFGAGLTAEISCDMHEDIPRLGFIEVRGAGGTVRLDNPVHPYRSCTLHTPSETTSLSDRPDWAAQTTYDWQLSAIVDALTHGTQPPTSGQDAIAQMQAIDEIYRLSGLAALSS
ncbi:Gfo/Idh/MocA family protein [Litorimonas sp. RW-G-Af-16]|uniref:Gfo/Idh/MocA family protein n=1 Tax=Litorimonas sp. RW-G-Af-16 TaxID=3241168 RepID=UPI00390CBB12